MHLDLATLIPLVIQASIVLLVVGLGLRATFADATYLLRRPGLLGRSYLAMFVVVPLFATLLAQLFSLHPPVKAAIVLMAVSPVPPFLPTKQRKFGGSTSYVYGLLVAASLLAFLYLPLALEVLGRVFHRQINPAAGPIAKVVLISVLVPLGVGLALRQVAPGLADRIEPWVSRLANGLLLAALVPILVTTGPGILTLIGNGTIVAFAAVVVVGLIAGHLLGGPHPGDRPILALAAATRHPGVALAIANSNFPGEKLVLAAVMLFVLVNLGVTLPYAAWCKRRHAGTSGGVAARVSG
jgi:BASS family bile acid:Na+ symporter